MPSATARINPEDFVLSEINQSQEDKYCNYFHVYEVSKIVKFVDSYCGLVLPGAEGR